MEVDVRHTQDIDVALYYNPNTECVPLYMVKVESRIPKSQGEYVLETSDPVEALDFFKHPMVHCLKKQTISNLIS
jgi:hypothetical protein